ncbi:zinc ribbon domain-containing protein [Anaerovibrio sp. RM50]|uniref:zinc ribbon domain-containing protein n=1 Tax=Anaerovibrio sp. RM50 TaxID=1200557 RepID=UPI0004842AD8|nr:zinc ribbon domain-containing protein [Anaerovibrio sp. RM50]
MFCHNCGKEIADGMNFCPYCGKTQDLSDKGMKNEPAGDVDNTLSSAKNISNQVKEAVEDKAKVYVDMAKEKAQNFADDVKQVTKDKDTSSFFKKNNNRNTKIVAGIIMAMLALFVLIGNSSEKNISNSSNSKVSNSSERKASNIAEELAAERVNNDPREKLLSTSTWMIAKHNGDDRINYLIIVSADLITDNGFKATRIYRVFTLKDGTNDIVDIGFICPTSTKEKKRRIGNTIRDFKKSLPLTVLFGNH